MDKRDHAVQVACALIRAYGTSKDVRKRFDAIAENCELTWEEAIASQAQTIVEELYRHHDA